MRAVVSSQPSKCRKKDKISGNSDLSTNVKRMVWWKHSYKGFTIKATSKYEDGNVSLDMRIIHTVSMVAKLLLV